MALARSPCFTMGAMRRLLPQSLNGYLLAGLGVF
ncbi:MAG: hypothetical protein RL684_2275, partial [Pseudomonadota bacterium]